ncbi:uncharacterized protein PHA67_003124 isoform 2-T2 [Liasis olivaceus]
MCVCVPVSIQTHTHNTCTSQRERERERRHKSLPFITRKELLKLNCECFATAPGSRLPGNRMQEAVRSDDELGVFRGKVKPSAGERGSGLGRLQSTIPEAHDPPRQPERMGASPPGLVLCGWRWTTQGRPAGPAASRLSLPSLHTSSYAHMESAGYGMLRTSFSSQNPDGKVLGAQGPWTVIKVHSFAIKTSLPKSEVLNIGNRSSRWLAWTLPFIFFSQETHGLGSTEGLDLAQNQRVSFHG